MMLRNAIAGVAILMLVAVAAIAVEEPGARPGAVMLAILVAAILFENRRYRHRDDPAIPGMTPTKERFVDPETGKSLRVWSGPGGERRYIED